MPVTAEEGLKKTFESFNNHVQPFNCINPDLTVVAGLCICGGSDPN